MVGVSRIADTVVRKWLQLCVVLLVITLASYGPLIPMERKAKRCDPRGHPLSDWDLHPLCWGCMAQAGCVCTRDSTCSICETWSEAMWRKKELSLARAVSKREHRRLAAEAKGRSALTISVSPQNGGREVSHKSRLGAGSMPAGSGIPVPTRTVSGGAKGGVATQHSSLPPHSHGSGSRS